MTLIEYQCRLELWKAGLSYMKHWNTAQRNTFATELGIAHFQPLT